MKKIYKSFIIISLITSLCLATYFIFQRFGNEETVIPVVKSDKIVIPARPNTFAEGRNVFVNTVKLARIASLKNNQEDAENYTEQALVLWRDVVNEFINTPPSNISDQEEWVASLSAIYESIQKADQLLKNSEIVLATKKLDESRALLNNINSGQENNKTDNKLFVLLLNVKKIDTSKSLDEAREYLGELKLAYTEIKNIKKEVEFEKLCQNFETILSEIDNATITTFPKAQTKLMPAFVEIYEKY